MQGKCDKPSAFALISQGKTVKKTKQSEVVEDPDDGVEVDDGDDDGDNDVDEDEESPFRDPPEGCVRLRPSQFHGIPATVFVEYPPELSIRRIDHSVVEPLGQRKLGYKSYWERICIKNAHCRAGFQKSEKFWTSLWSKHQNADQMRELNCLQKINHFPASWCIGRKDRLTRTLNTMKRVHGANGNLFDIHPETYILPGERESLGRLIKSEISASLSGTHRAKSFNSTNATMSAAGGMWIVKPCAASCGQGIKVMTGQQAMALPKKKKAVVQRYLARPYLIDGRKFDLRIYVLVSGVDPLRVYIHDEGLTRISTAKYTLKNLTNNFAHLTNYSINKNAPNFKAAEFSTKPKGGAEDGNAEDGSSPATGSAPTQDPEMEGFKWSLAAFRRWLAQQEGREVMEQTFDRIFDLCLKSVIAAEGEITPHLHSSAQYRTNCFELFGCDVILDSDLRPHLLEVNVSPSLMGSSPLDKKIKGMVIADILHIVGLYPHDPALLKKYDTNNGSASSASTAISTSSKGSSAKTTNPAGEGNPFAFSSLSKMMNAQDRYRRSPSVDTIDIAALGDTEASWMLLLMAEDELLRAKSSKFHCVHPTSANAEYYTGLYRSVRFSDHLLAHWIISGGSRGKCGKHIPYKYRPVQAVARGSPEKTVGSPAGRVEYGAASSSANRARAKSAGRTTSATQRASTYNPHIAPSSEKLRRGGAVTSYHSEHDLVGHTSRRSLHEQQLVEGGAGNTPESRSQARGRSEPRAAREASPSASAVVREEPKKAFASSPVGTRPQLPTTPSSVRTRLETGISKAAFYAAGIADLSLSPNEDRKKADQTRPAVSEFDDESSMRESVEVAASPSSVRQPRNTTGVLRQARPVPIDASLAPFAGEMSAPVKPRISQASVDSRGASGRHSRPTSASKARQGSIASGVDSNPASSSNSVAPSDDGTTPLRNRAIRPSTSSKALVHSGSAHKLQMELSLGGTEKTRTVGAPRTSAATVASSSAANEQLFVPAPAARSKQGDSPASGSAQHPPASTAVASRGISSTGGAATHSAVSAAAGVLTEEAVVDVISKVEKFLPPRGPVSPKSGIPLSPSPSLARPMLNEFAMFNEQIRARATASREDSRSYLQNSASHAQDVNSPLKQRRVSLTKYNDSTPNNSTGNGTGSSKNLDGVLHSAIHSAGPGSVRSQSKQDLLEQVHKTLFAAAPGGNTGSASSPTYQSARSSPVDMGTLQLQPQIAAHPSFSQPISPSPSTSILQQQRGAFGNNTAIVKPVASGKIIQYGNPSAHPGSRYAK